jgi:hypothetical protein
MAWGSVLEYPRRRIGMKKLLFIVAVMTLLVAGGCGAEKFYTVKISNGSTTKTVKYSYNNLSNEELPPETDRSYEVKAHTQPPKNLVDQDGFASVSLEYESMTGNFSFADAVSYPLKVKNDLPFAITISANKFIVNGTSTSLTVNAGATNTSATIYTDRPAFTSTSSYPVTFVWKKTGDVIDVTIK